MKFLTTLRLILCVCVFSRFTQVRLFVTLWTVAHQAPLSVGFSHAMILVWVAIPSSRRSSQSRYQTHVFCVSCIAGGFFPLSHRGKTQASGCLSIKQG